MNRRDFLGLLGKGAIVASIPLSAQKALANLPEFKNRKLDLRYELRDYDTALAVCIKIERPNDIDYHNAVIMDVENADPDKMIDVLWSSLKKSNPEVIRGLRKPTVREHLSGIERHLS